MIRKKINSLSGSKKTMDKYYASIYQEELEIGLVYPQLTLDNFARHWETLDVKEKFRHYLGFINYIQPISDISRLYETKWNFKEFIENSILSLDIFPFVEYLNKKYLGRVDIKFLCIGLSKFLLLQYQKHK